MEGGIAEAEDDAYHLTGDSPLSTQWVPVDTSFHTLSRRPCRDSMLHSG